MIKIEVNNINSKIVGNISNAIIYDLYAAMTYKTDEFNGFNFVTIDHVLYNRQKQSFPTGLFSKAADIFETHNIDYDVIDNRSKPATNKPLKLHAKLRPYQSDIVEAAIDHQRFVIQVATGGGKTVIAGAILARLNMPSIFVVHTGDLFEQAYDDLTQLLQIPIGKIGGGECDIKKINVCMVQTIHAVLGKEYVPFDEVEKEQMENDTIVKKSYLRNDSIKRFLQTVQCIMVDECFHEKTRVMIDHERQVKIKEIYENDKITHVLSYNHEKNTVEKKKILRKIRSKCTDKWWIVTVKIGSKIIKLKTTAKHKFWTVNRGYVRVDELLQTDVLKFYSNAKNVKVCDICGYVGETMHIGGHYSMHNNTNPFTNGKGFVTRSANKTYCKKLSERMKKNNPSFRPEVIEKMKISWQKNFNNKSEEEKTKVRQNWINAPLKSKNKVWKPTRFEQKLIDLQLPELAYTGDGRFWLTVGKKANGRKWSKNPDFKVRKRRKVIEVGDICHWHTKEEIEKLICAYESINFECLYLTNVDFEDDHWDDTKNKIFKFVYNHDEAVVLDVKYCYEAHSDVDTQYRYNLEVEDNHNYFANGILVSNCHHLSANSYVETMKVCKSSYFRGGLSATPETGTGRDMVLQAYAGSIVAQVSASYLIEHEYLVRPKIYYLQGSKNAAYKFSRKKYKTIYKLYIVNNAYRNQLIVDCVKRLHGLNKSILITVTTKNHGHLLLKMIRAIDGISCEFIYSHVDKMLRKKYIDQVRNKQLDVILGTSLADEGLNIPALDSLILAGGGKSPTRVIQRIGRTLRLSDGKTEAIVIDFKDNLRYLIGHYKKRRAICEQERQFQLIDSF